MAEIRGINFDPHFKTIEESNLPKEKKQEIKFLVNLAKVKCENLLQKISPDRITNTIHTNMSKVIDIINRLIAQIIVIKHRFDLSKVTVLNKDIDDLTRHLDVLTKDENVLNADENILITTEKVEFQNIYIETDKEIYQRLLDEVKIAKKQLEMLNPRIKDDFGIKDKVKSAETELAQFFAENLEKIKTEYLDLCTIEDENITPELLTKMWEAQKKYIDWFQMGMRDLISTGIGSFSWLKDPFEYMLDAKNLKDYKVECHDVNNLRFIKVDFIQTNRQVPIIGHINMSPEDLSALVRLIKVTYGRSFFNFACKDFNGIWQKESLQEFLEYRKQNTSELSIQITGIDSLSRFHN